MRKQNNMEVFSRCKKDTPDLNVSGGPGKDPSASSLEWMMWIVVLVVLHLAPHFCQATSTTNSSPEWTMEIYCCTEASYWRWSCNKNTSVTPSESSLLPSTNQLSPHMPNIRDHWKTGQKKLEGLLIQLPPESRNYEIRAACSGHFPVRTWRSPRLQSPCGWPLSPFLTVVLPYTDMNLISTLMLQPRSGGEESRSISLESTSQTQGLLFDPAKPLLRAEPAQVPQPPPQPILGALG